MAMGTGESTQKSLSCQTSRIDKESNLEKLGLCPGALPKRLSLPQVPDECDGNGNSSGSGSGGCATDVLLSVTQGKASQLIPRDPESVMDMSLADSLASCVSEFSRTRRRRRREQLSLDTNGEAEKQRLQLERALKSLEAMQRENQERMRHTVPSCGSLSPSRCSGGLFCRTKSDSATAPSLAPRHELLERAHTLLALPDRIDPRSPRIPPGANAQSPPISAQSSEPFATPRGGRGAVRRSASPPVIILTVDSRRTLGEEDARKLLSVEGGRAASYAKMQQTLVLAAGLSPSLNTVTPPPQSMSSLQERARCMPPRASKESSVQARELFKQREPSAPKEPINPKEKMETGELKELRENRPSKGPKEPVGTREVREPKKMKERKDIQEPKNFRKVRKSESSEIRELSTRCSDVLGRAASPTSASKGRAGDGAKPQLLSPTSNAPRPVAATRQKGAPKENRPAAEKAAPPRQSVGSRVSNVSEERMRRDAAEPAGSTKRRESGVAAQAERRQVVGSVRLSRLSLSPELSKHIASPPPRSGKPSFYLGRKSIGAIPHPVPYDHDIFRGLATERSTVSRVKDNGVSAPSSRNQRSRFYGGENSLDRQLVPFCTECGKKHIDDRGKFCAYCGHKREVCK